MNLRNILLMFTGVLLLFTGCRDFEQLNTNPNEPEQVQPSLLLPGIIRKSVNSQVNESYLTGNIVTQKASKTLRVENEIYEWGSFSNTWTPLYESLRDVENLKTIAQEREDARYEGIALVLKAWIFSILTDAYGDIPYFEATKAKEGNYTPAYTSQKDIYLDSEEGLLALLEQANTLLDGSAENVTGDILYNGDVMKWKKLANSLHLRLLLRLTDRDDQANDPQSVARQGLERIVSNPSGYPIFESNDDNAALSYTGSFPNEFPLNPLKIGDKDAVVPSLLLVDTFKATNDPRLMVFARTVAPGLPEDDYDSYLGRPNGFLPQNVPAPYDDTTLSRLGTIYYDYTGFQSAGDLADGLIMTYSELQFILAEAREKGWIDVGSAEDYYENGVQASMDYYNVDYTNAGLNSFSDYISQSSIAYSGDQNQKLARIAFQKWIATWFTGLEGWFDWRRTRMPALDAAENSVIGDRFPVRFIYPGEEQNLNLSNYNDAVDNIGGDNITTEMWLTK